jgi:small subunit ribosomal protein S17
MKKKPMDKKDKNISRKKGIVVSDKMDKTIVVSVEIMKTHSKYKKKYLSTKRYKVHDGDNKHKIGDTVEITMAKPASRGKFYKIV